jgi:hypothetical protein
MIGLRSVRSTRRCLGHWDHAAVFGRKQEYLLAQLAEIALALGGAGGVPHAGNRRYEDRGKDSDDGDHGEQLDERERSSAGGTRGGRKGHAYTIIRSCGSVK